MELYHWSAKLRLKSNLTHFKCHKKRIAWKTFLCDFWHLEASPFPPKSVDVARSADVRDRSNSSRICHRREAS